MKTNKVIKLILVVSILILLCSSSFYYFYTYHKRQSQPNILLITIDALRPDHLGCYGYEIDTSPNIDKLAKEGFLFKEAISQATWTWPSIHSLLTSTFPSTHKVQFYDSLLPENFKTLSSILKESNYVTAFFSAHVGMSSLRDTFGRNFDLFKVSEIDAAKLTKLVLNCFDNIQNKRFFLWLHYMDTHEGKLGFTEAQKFHEHKTEKYLKEMNDFIIKYDEAIDYVDRQIYFIIRHLKEIGLYKNTVIIITADHGEEMGEHSWYFSHGSCVWDSVIKVPLIFSYPQRFSKNRSVFCQVQLIDIAPTICDILGIKKPETFEGKSFFPLMSGKEERCQYAFSEHKQVKKEFLSSNKVLWSQFSIRSNKYKLILTADRSGKNYKLYNLKTDPLELNNLTEYRKKPFNLLKNKLEEWMNRPKLNILSSAKSLNKEEKERLKSLGYLQ